MISKNIFYKPSADRATVKTVARRLPRAVARRLPRAVARRLPKTVTRWLVRAGIGSLILFLLFLLLNWFFPLPDKIEYSTIVTDNKGEVINAYLTSDQKWRMKTELNEISPLLQKTIIAKEDRYFYSHPGVNPLAVGRALFKNTFRMKRTSGASTITMQVARALEPRKRNLGSKLIEMFRAFQLEWKYDKDEILQLYLNLDCNQGKLGLFIAKDSQTSTD